jgi:YVTN family beta-propeller protein
MKHSLRLTRIALAAVSLAACCLLNCDSKPPTPVISGPDSGWVRAPVLFRAFNPDGSPNTRRENWSWGDGSPVTSGSIHEYPTPGNYSVVCVAISSGGAPTPDVPSDPSLPHPIRILEDTLVHPDTIVATIAIGQRAGDWACVLPDGGKLYVTNAAADSVSVMDTHTNSVSAVIAVPDSPVCCVASTSGQYVYVSCLAARSVAVIDAAGDSVIRTISIDGKPDRLGILPNDSFLYVAHGDSAIVSVVSTSDDSVVARVAVAGIPTGIAVKPGGEYVYVASETGIAVIRTSDNTVTLSATVSGSPADVEFSPTGDTVYAPCPSARNLVLLRSSNLTSIDQVSHDSLGWQSPRHASVLPGGQCIYVTSSQSTAGPAIVRRSDNYLLRLTGVGKSRVAVPSPDGRRVYVPATAGIVVLGLRPGR